ncbi:MAG: exodeoxyribonuclease VII small subunit [Bacteroidales bacterium]|jgi:exodeoxyribonuclease VII small subunit|nr:exodeoxyribonuclease VII small subunit [Bacteroidales bacterium]MDD2618639.1 exodeoxyribonuclease VII small subunit [Bacteroidales bacterium]MDD4641101.1 exodeoxyribonuclease VII small subunit [Bacteroidales bacterium]
MKTNITYKKAIEELEQILQFLEQSEPDVDQMTQKLKRATELIGFCREKLHKTDEELQAIFKELEQK